MGTRMTSCSNKIRKRQCWKCRYISLTASSFFQKLSTLIAATSSWWGFGHTHRFCRAWVTTTWWWRCPLAGFWQRHIDQLILRLPCIGILVSHAFQNLSWGHIIRSQRQLDVCLNPQHSRHVLHFLMFLYNVIPRPCWKPPGGHAWSLSFWSLTPGSHGRGRAFSVTGWKL